MVQNDHSHLCLHPTNSGHSFPEDKDSSRNSKEYIRNNRELQSYKLDKDTEENTSTAQTRTNVPRTSKKSVVRIV